MIYHVDFKLYLNITPFQKPLSPHATIYPVPAQNHEKDSHMAGETEKVICNGCRVPEPWLHQCKGKVSIAKDGVTNKPCECEDCLGGVICDGCAVRTPHEHRCHGDPCMIMGHHTNLHCECEDCRAGEVYMENLRKEKTE